MPEGTAAALTAERRHGAEREGADARRRHRQRRRALAKGAKNEGRHERGWKSGERRRCGEIAGEGGGGGSPRGEVARSPEEAEEGTARVANRCTVR